jgi:hypothetical protein
VRTERGNSRRIELEGIENMLRFLKFLGARKKFWLPPFVLVMLFFLGAVLLAKGPAIAPFIYRPV